MSVLVFINLHKKLDSPFLHLITSITQGDIENGLLQQSNILDWSAFHGTISISTLTIESVFQE